MKRKISLLHVMGGWEIDDPLNMKYFLKLSAKALLEAFWLVKQKQQLGDHFGKYTKKIESILQKKNPSKI